MNEASREEKYRIVATAGAGSISHPDEIGLYYQRRLAPPIYWVGAGIGRMLDTFQPLGVFTNS